MTYIADPRVDAYIDAMFKHIIANNRAGGWRTLKRKSEKR
jgi:hypothetical protein